MSACSGDQLGLVAANAFDQSLDGLLAELLGDLLRAPD